MIDWLIVGFFDPEVGNPDIYLGIVSVKINKNTNTNTITGAAISIVPNYVIDIASVQNQGLLGLLPQLLVNFLPWLILCSLDG